METLTRIFLLIVPSLCFFTEIGAFADVCPREISLGSLEYGEKSRNTFLKMYEISLVNCTKECRLYSRCRSFNYHRGLTLCELSSDDAEDRQSANGFVVSKLSSWNMDWLGPCSRHTCSDNTKCKILTTVKKECAPFEECKSPPTVQNATPNSTTATVGSVIQYTCSPGYNATDGAPRVMCQPGRYWTNPEFMCRFLVSCKDVYQHAEQPNSGVFTIYPDGNEVRVYCDFFDGFGYTYISKHSLNNLTSLNKLYTNNSLAKVRHIRSNGQQNEVTVEQLSQYKDEYPLGFLLNNHEGYNKMLNVAMAPYLYLGFLPKSFVAKGTTQGYRAADQDQTFINCDNNANSYIGFLSNPSDLQPIQYCSTCVFSLTRKWIELATSVQEARKMPDEFYYFFEMHMGGCGGYTTPTHISEVDGAAIGFRFDADV